MSFGLCPHTNKTWQEKFNERVFEAFPGVTAKMQHERAAAIEKAFVGPRTEEWARGSKRYLFFMINRHNATGFFYDCPAVVQECEFLCSEYPADFRWFVVDPEVRDEVLFMAQEIDDFWDVLKHQRRTTKRPWWFRTLSLHRKWEQDYASAHYDDAFSETVALLPDWKKPENHDKFVAMMKERMSPSKAEIEGAEK